MVTVGLKMSAWASRVRLFTPSAAITRSWPHGEFGGGRCLGAKAQPYPQGLTALVQDFEELTAAEGGETVAAGGQGAAPVDDVDVVPADELALEGGVDGGVGVLDAAEGLVGQDDPEAEGVVGGVALEDGYLAPGVEPFEQDGGVQPAGSAADDGDLQGRGGGAGARHGQRPCHLGAASR